MKYNKTIIIGIFIILLIGILVFPIIFNERVETSTVGPSLSEIEYTEIYFKNGDLNLSGMLLIPEGEGPFPTAVIIHGSGTSKRDNAWYLTFAKHLQDNGIAVLLPDKRGSEKSEGDWTNSSLIELSEDTVSAVEFVKGQTQFNYSYIGLVGMSQGGWIAPVAAAESEDVSFVVSISGAAVTPDEQLLHEETNNIAELGVYRFMAELIAPISTKNIQKKESWIKIYEGFDPIPYWKKVDVPVFAAFGENDPNVPVNESVKRLQEIEDLDIKIKVYPEGSHGIWDPNTSRVNDQFLTDLTEFIKSIDRSDVT
jgi:dipeptidyl aminopeptidase/acylaminoacyl peptidase